MMNSHRASAALSGPDLKPLRAGTGLAQLEPVVTTDLHELAYRQLRQAIMQGKFRPGEKLTLRSLAASLGTSIMPVRDAILRLVSEHALERKGRRIQIPNLDRDQLADVWRFRIALEGEAAALAAVRATEKEINAIIQSAARARKAQTQKRIDQYVTANQRFHFAVYRAAHNDLLQSLIESLWLQIGPYLGVLVANAENTLEFGPDSHDWILDALRSRDAEDARRALIADLNDSVDIFSPLDATIAAAAQ